ncbi:MAG: hypothetical protein C3F12_06455 [Candidatus Methylomirabilota bacterium]|nr:PEP-CTERM sorting domain-containing protein [candidate division NC10 bacterium]PWB46575.1 MAG: hypothetical protein C3F12_06455 [candidate division NC10 bacterium]
MGTIMRGGWWRGLTVGVACVVATAAAGRADAVPMTAFGQPVTALSGPGSNTQAVPTCGTGACYNPATGQITYFIPLSSANAGIYGVTVTPSGFKSGMFSDFKAGTFDNSSVLTMYLRFSPIASLSLDSAHLTFGFSDLDLNSGNDPPAFTESIRFFDVGWSPMTPLITVIGQSGGSPVPFTVSGDSSTQTIDFPDITSLITGDPFFVELQFGSKTTERKKWFNTPESLIATLQTEITPAPEPGTLLLLGSGLAGLAIMARNRVSNPSRSKGQTEE